MGKYQLIRKLATGGMAEVFLAKSSGPFGFEKLLVVKRILPHLAENPQFVEMFLTEAKLAARLNHANIVQIFDFGMEAGAYFIAMEYVDGLDLRTLSRRAFKQGQPIAFPLAVRLISLACEGLAYAHELADPETGQPLGLIHRDISTDNIFVSKTGGVKVLDFGIAKASNVGQRTNTGILKGKVAYMAPEYLLGEEGIDARADVYALGVVLYELIAGRKPYKHDSDVLLIRAVLEEPLPDVRTFRQGTPDQLVTVLSRALAKDRSQRYASCREFHAALERFLYLYSDPVGAVQIAELVRNLGSDTAPESRSPPTPTPPEAQPPQPTLEVQHSDAVRTEPSPAPQFAAEATQVERKRGASPLPSSMEPTWPHPVPSPPPAPASFEEPTQPLPRLVATPPPPSTSQDPTRALPRPAQAPPSAPASPESARAPSKPPLPPPVPAAAAEPAQAPSKPSPKPHAPLASPEPARTTSKPSFPSLPEPASLEPARAQPKPALTPPPPPSSVEPARAPSKPSHTPPYPPSLPEPARALPKPALTSASVLVAPELARAMPKPALTPASVPAAPETARALPKPAPTPVPALRPGTARPSQLEVPVGKEPAGPPLAAAKAPKVRPLATPAPGAVRPRPNGPLRSQDPRWARASSNVQDEALPPAPAGWPRRYLYWWAPALLLVVAGVAIPFAKSSFSTKVASGDNSRLEEGNSAETPDAGLPRSPPETPLLAQAEARTGAQLDAGAEDAGSSVETTAAETTAEAPSIAAPVQTPTGEARIQVLSNLPGEVSINGKHVGWTGETPILHTLSPGKKVRVTVKGTVERGDRTDWFEKTETVDLAANDEHTVRFNFRKLKFTIRGRPADLVVLWVDDEAFEENPVLLYEGQHDLVLRDKHTDKRYETQCQTLVKGPIKLCEFDVQVAPASPAPAPVQEAQPEPALAPAQKLAEAPAPTPPSEEKKPEDEIQAELRQLEEEARQETGGPLPQTLATALQKLRDQERQTRSPEERKNLFVGIKAWRQQLRAARSKSAAPSPVLPPPAVSPETSRQAPPAPTASQSGVAENEAQRPNGTAQVP